MVDGSCSFIHGAFCYPFLTGLLRSQSSRSFENHPEASPAWSTMRTPVMQIKSPKSNHIISHLITKPSIESLTVFKHVQALLHTGLVSQCLPVSHHVEAQDVMVSWISSVQGSEACSCSKAQSLMLLHDQARSKGPRDSVETR